MLRSPALALRAFAVALLALALGLGVAGCPREPDAPEPGAGTPCSDQGDCNTSDCGLLRLCIDGFCEQGASLVLPCAGEGNPVQP